MTVAMEHLVEALNRTMKTMAGCEVVNRSEKPALEDGIRADVSAHVALLDDMELCVVITVSEGAAVDLVRLIAGTEVSFDDSLVGDTVGELLNVIVGSAQKKGRFQFSIPVIAKGKGHEVKILSDGYSQCVVSAWGEREIGLYVIERKAR